MIVPPGTMQQGVVVAGAMAAGVAAAAGAADTAGIAELAVGAGGGAPVCADAAKGRAASADHKAKREIMGSVPEPASHLLPEYGCRRAWHSLWRRPELWPGAPAQV
jgi:hypothetical protein